MYVIPDCLSSAIVYHFHVCNSPLSTVTSGLSFPIVCHHHLSGIPYCLTFPIIYHSQLSFILHYMLFLLYVNIHCLQFPSSVISHCQPSYTWYSPLFVIFHCLQIVFHPLLSGISIVCLHYLPFPLSVISHCLASSFIWYFPLSVIFYFM